MLISKKKFLIVLFQFIWTVFIIFVFGNGLNRVSMFSSYLWLSYVLIFMSMCIGIYEIKALSGRSFCISAIFLIITYVFHHGHHMLGLFNIKIDYYSDYIMTNFGDSSICQATAFSIIVINCMQFGMCMALKMKEDIPCTTVLFEKNEDEMIKNDNMIKTWAKILCIVCMLPTVYYDLSRIVISFISSYSDAYTYGLNSITLLASGFMELGLLGLLYVYRNNEKWRYVYYSKMIWELIKLVFIGNRMGPISSIIVFYIFRHQLIPNRKERGKLFYLILCVSGLFVMGFVSAFRAGRGDNSLIETFVQALTSKNAIVSFFSESGTTLLDLVMLFRLMPNTIPFASGLTYLNSLLIVVPFASVVFGSGISEHISIGVILNRYWFNRGLGGSMIAEMYYNFGWLSCIGFVLIGILVCVFQNRYYKTIENHSNGLVVIVFSFILEQILIFPRGYFYSIMQYVNISIYALVFFWILNSFVRRRS